MRLFLMATAAAFMTASVPAMAQTAPAAAPAKTKYSTAETDIGTLLDDPAAKAIVEKHIPGLTTNEQIDMARGMTLKVVQQYSPDEVTDARLAAIDADLAKLK
ncbi:hypothetical protein [Sphingobium sp. DC-2]|uniref:hypothetical protein n=1 Tax=Sphingobium sp. DC-2 TaxID=1303256 RepID=UPI0004C2FB1F|nr:hypothetical protein [Sphingobium sp. DC-2]